MYSEKVLTDREVCPGRGDYRMERMAVLLCHSVDGTKAPTTDQHSLIQTEQTVSKKSQ